MNISMAVHPVAKGHVPVNQYQYMSRSKQTIMSCLLDNNFDSVTNSLMLLYNNKETMSNYLLHCGERCTV